MEWPNQIARPQSPTVRWGKVLLAAGADGGRCRAYSDLYFGVAVPLNGSRLHGAESRADPGPTVGNGQSAV
jgi:hypothetical protein